MDDLSGNSGNVRLNETRYVYDALDRRLTTAYPGNSAENVTAFTTGACTGLASAS